MLRTIAQMTAAKARARRLAAKHPGRGFAVCALPDGRPAVLTDWAVPHSGARVVRTYRKT